MTRRGGGGGGGRDKENASVSPSPRRGSKSRAGQPLRTRNLNVADPPAQAREAPVMLCCAKLGSSPRTLRPGNSGGRGRSAIARVTRACGGAPEPAGASPGGYNMSPTPAAEGGECHAAGA